MSEARNLSSPRLAATRADSSDNGHISARFFTANAACQQAFCRGQLEERFDIGERAIVGAFRLAPREIAGILRRALELSGAIARRQPQNRGRI